MAMRVNLDVTPLLGRPTGIGHFTSALVRGLAGREDVQAKGFALSLRGFRGLSDVLPPGWRHNRFPMPAGPLMGLWAVMPFPSVDWWTGGADVVHGTNFVAPPTRRAATLVTVHDLTALRYPELCEPVTLQYPELVKVAVRRGAHVHTLSMAIAREVHDLLGVDESRLHVVRPGVPEVAPTPAGRGRRIAGCDRYVLAIGTIEPRKDFPTLVRAFDRLADEHDVDLVIAGASGWGADALHAALVAARHRDRIRLLGPVSEMQRAALLRDAAALAYPSVYEGFGLPPLEAMSVGVPVVATSSPAVAEVTADAAVLVHEGDVVGLAGGLSMVLGDEAERQRLVRAGLDRADAFDRDLAIGAFVDLYRGIAGR